MLQFSASTWFPISTTLTKTDETLTQHAYDTSSEPYASPGDPPLIRGYPRCGTKAKQILLLNFALVTAYFGLLALAKLPEWVRDQSNHWILRGYRPISGSSYASLYSWSYVHESDNIYSHLIPAILFLFAERHIQRHLVSRYPGLTGADRTAFSIFTSAAVVCMSLSVTYRTFMNHSQNREKTMLVAR